MRRFVRCQRHQKWRRHLREYRTLERLRAGHRRQLSHRLLPWLDGHQKHVAKDILDVGQQMRASRRERIAAIMTALVETFLRNLPYGHGTSIGWRQEIDTYGSAAVRLDVRGVARRFFTETRAAGPWRFATAGQLAQAVQRSAFPGRYDQRLSQALAVIRWWRILHR